MARAGSSPGSPAIGDLRPLALEEGPDGFYAAVGNQVLHLVCFPLVFLVAAFGYLRRTSWAHRRMLGGACLVAVLFDAGQWWMRQGLPVALWAAWLAAVGLAAAMLVLMAVVLWNLWGPNLD